MAIAPPLWVPAPTLTPARFGLFDAADIVIENDDHFRNGIEYQPAPCTPAKLAAQDCFPPADPGDPDPRERDIASGLPLTHSGPITVYNGFSCKLPGLTEAQIQSFAERALAGGESTAVETAVWGDLSNVDVTDSTLAPNPLRLMGPDTTILTTAAVDLVKGIALLEDHLAQTYGGVGILHAPRGVSAYAAERQQIRFDGGRPVTAVGTKWAFGAYPNTDIDGVEAATDTAWLVVTSAVNIRRSPVQRRPLDMRGVFSPTDNEALVLAERTYVVAWDCVHAAALVTL